VLSRSALALACAALQDLCFPASALALMSWILARSAACRENKAALAASMEMETQKPAQEMDPSP